MILLILIINFFSDPELIHSLLRADNSHIGDDDDDDDDSSDEDETFLTQTDPKRSIDANKFVLLTDGKKLQSSSL